MKGKAGSGRFVSRGGDKLAAALEAFAVNPVGWACADLGCNVGGFTDCLLQFGASRVYAVDTGYGQLAWKLRKDDRVVVMERTNALHVELPEAVRLVTIDVAWTRQELILPAALQLVSEAGRIITLIKPHYEADRADLRRGVLAEDRIEPTLQRMGERLVALGIHLAAVIDSPLKGQKGNREFLGLIRRADYTSPRHSDAAIGCQ